MSSRKPSIIKSSKLDKSKIEKAKGLSKTEQAHAATKQEQKLKSSKPAIQEFDEWK